MQGEARQGDMALDELSTPLGLPAASPSAAKRKAAAGVVLRAVIATPLLIVAGLLAYASLTHDPLGGEPHVVSAIVAVEPPAVAPPAAQEPAPSAAQEPAPAAQSPVSTSAELEAQSGIVVHRGDASAPKSLIITVPDAETAVRLAAVDPALGEPHRHGVIPVVAIDGRRPLDHYARPLTDAQKSGKARVAIVVGGLGIGQSITREAIAKLPAPVTLAFAPYGGQLIRQVERARADGHEVMLHLPMEPFDYPDNDPGPQTLVSGRPAIETIDRLHWLMSRFRGYVGVMNFMGARFMSSGDDFRLVARELASRGIGFVDDGSVARVRAAEIVRGEGVPAVAADLVIDANATPEAIDAALARLETIAIEKGAAVGVASAMPVSVERLKRWQDGLAERGITLVPASALLRAGAR
jgi:polysaccharide deacetylase 2 family uncharacterized protein YibQ